MSHNFLYIAPATELFQQLASTNDALCHVIMEQKAASILYTNQAVGDYTLAEGGVESKTCISQWVMTAPEFNADFINQLVDIVAQPYWHLGAIKPCLDVKTFSIELSVELSAEQSSALLALCNTAKVDLNNVSNVPTLSKPGLVVLDMDSTSITIECIDEIAKLANVGDQVAEITELAMQGKLDFSQSLISRVGKLKGIELSLLDTIANDLPLMPGMAQLVKQFKKYEWKVAIASGGFTYFADSLKDLLSLDEAVSNTLSIADGKLTGEVEGQIVDAQVKADTVVALAEKYNIDLSQTIAIGDGANDLKMMDKAALGVAFHAKPLVQEQADVAVNFGNLTSVMALLSHG